MSIFSHVTVPRLRRSFYRYNFEHKLSFRMGYLVPLRRISIVPGDSIKSLSIECFTRMAPMIFPVMHRMNIKLYAFYVPNRIVWDDWNDFIFGGPDGTLEPAHPYIDPYSILHTGLQSEAVYKTVFKVGQLADYMGIPVTRLLDETYYGSLEPMADAFSSLPFRAYQMIYNEYFRDQNVIKEVSFNTAQNGDEVQSNSLLVALELLQLRRKAWQKDYFTSALPWLQRGPATAMPVSVDMTGVGVNITTNGAYKDALEFQRSDGGTPAEGNLQADYKSGGQQTLQVRDSSGNVIYPSNLSQYLDAVLTDSNPDVASFLVEDLRRAIQTQMWRERNARGGARPNEQLYAHFGVRSSDARLQRPEFLGACSMPISISEVLQSSESTSEGTPLGEMGGHGISARGALLVKNRFFEEHGSVYVIMSCLPKTGYFQGIERDLFKFDRFDYWWPEFAHIGEQPIYTKELYLTGKKSDDEAIFGYTPRYAEYQFFHDTVAGEFRDTLKSWHMAREFSNIPRLNSQFISAEPTDRIFPTQYRDVEQMYGQFLFHLNMKRSILKGATPHI